MKNSLLMFFFIVFYSVGIGQINPPTFEWARSLGGFQPDDLIDVAADLDGNVYALGFYTDGAIIGDSVLAHSAPQGSGEMFIAKYDSKGDFIWVRSTASHSETLNSTVGFDLVCDEAGAVYVTGRTSFDSTSFGPDVVIDKGAFIVKYDREGEVIWGQGVGFLQLGTLLFRNNRLFVGGRVLMDSSIQHIALPASGSYLLEMSLEGEALSLMSYQGFEYVAAIEIDAENNIYLALSTGSLPVPSLILPFDTIPGGILKNRSILLRLDADRRLSWYWSLRGKERFDFVQIQAIKMSSAGFLAIAGFYDGIIDLPGVRVGDEDTEASHGHFLGSLTPDGEICWLKQVNGITGRQVRVNIDAFGGLYLVATGNISSPPRPIDFEGYGLTPPDSAIGEGDIYIARFEEDGNLLWVKQTAFDLLDIGETYISNTYLDTDGNLIFGMLTIGAQITFDDTSVLNLGGAGGLLAYLPFDGYKHRVAISDSSHFVVFPNPSSGHISILTDEPFSVYQVQLINVKGQIVYKRLFHSKKSIIELDLTLLSSGSYILQLVRDTAIHRQTRIQIN